MPAWDEPESEDDAMPQKRNTDRADPTEDRSKTFVTANRSQSIPSAMPPKMEVALKSETSIVPMVSGRPIVDEEYDGR